MYVDTLVLTGFEHTCRGIRALSEDVQYLVIRDISVPSREVVLERIEFDPSSLTPYLETGSEVSDDTSAAVEDDEDCTLEDEADSDASPIERAVMSTTGGTESSPGSQLLPNQYSHERLLDAVCQWTLRVCQRISPAAPMLHLRLQAYGVKGIRVLLTSSFWCKNSAFSEADAELARRSGLQRQQKESPPAGAGGVSASERPRDVSAGVPEGVSTYLDAGQKALATWSQAEAAALGRQAQARSGDEDPSGKRARPDMLIYPAGFQDGTLFGTVGAFQALNESYVNFGHALTTGMASLQGMMNQLLEARGEELVAARSQVHQLLTEVLENRVRETEVQQAVAGTRAEEQRTELAHATLNQLGETARTFLMARGMAGDGGELVQVLGSNPELLGALQDPAIITLLKNPVYQQALLGMLKQAAERLSGSEPGKAKAEVPAAQVRLATLPGPELSGPISAYSGAGGQGALASAYGASQAGAGPAGKGFAGGSAYGNRQPPWQAGPFGYGVGPGSGEQPWLATSANAGLTHPGMQAQAAGGFYAPAQGPQMGFPQGQAAGGFYAPAPGVHAGVAQAHAGGGFYAPAQGPQTGFPQGQAGGGFYAPAQGPQAAFPQAGQGSTFHPQSSQAMPPSSRSPHFQQPLPNAQPWSPTGGAPLAVQQPLRGSALPDPTASHRYGGDPAGGLSTLPSPSSSGFSPGLREHVAPTQEAKALEHNGERHSRPPQS